MLLLFVVMVLNLNVNVVVLLQIDLDQKGHKQHTNVGIIEIQHLMYQQV